MAKREPWLDWDNALAEAEEARIERARKAGRKHLRGRFTAYFLLFFYGYVGFHRFYLYDAKMGWRIFRYYMFFAVFVTVLNFLVPNNLHFLLPLAFLVLWSILLFKEIPFVAIRVAEINAEVDSYD